jgi:dihydroorotate dehydrogenase electron transfer subunit
LVPLDGAVRDQFNDGQPAYCDALVVANANVGDRYWQLRIEAPAIAECVAPGQFLMVTVASAGHWDPALPRPMAIFESNPREGTLDFVYGVVGRGTLQLTQFIAGERITVVGPLGRPFTLAQETRRVLLLGRGIGTCSLTILAGEAASRGLSVSALDSARHKGALVGRGAYERLGIASPFFVTDADGSSEVGKVRSLLVEHLSRRPPNQIFVCGSQRLLDLAADLAAEWGASVQVAVEAHMACGLGYCHGCASGLGAQARETPLVCRDGPVFRWERA